MNFLPEPDPEFTDKLKDEFHKLLTDKPSKFRLYQQDPGRWASLEAQVPGLVMETCGGAAPMQADGFIRGYPFYFRYEEFSADIKIGPWGQEEYPYGWGNVNWCGSYSMPDAKNFMELTPEQFEEAFTGTLASLRIAPMLWEFKGKDIRFNEATELFESTGEEKIYSILGYDSGEARAHFEEASDYMIEKMGQAKWDSCIRAQALEATPLNSDDRMIDAPPNFLS